MAGNNNANKYPVPPNPTLADVAISFIQRGLATSLPWIDKVYGKAQRLTRVVNGKRVYTPNVYDVGNDYISVMPDSNLGNFAFFWIEDPQDYTWINGVQSTISSTFSIIFWFDMRKVSGEFHNRNIERVKGEILKVLNGKVYMELGRFRINRIYELAENIYRGFSLDEVDNQFLMHPYAGLRFEGILEYQEPCVLL